MKYFQLPLNIYTAVTGTALILLFVSSAYASQFSGKWSGTYQTTLISRQPLTCQCNVSMTIRDNPMDPEVTMNFSNPTAKPGNVGNNKTCRNLIGAQCNGNTYTNAATIPVNDLYFKVSIAHDGSTDTQTNFVFTVKDKYLIGTNYDDQSSKITLSPAK